MILLQKLWVAYRKSNLFRILKRSDRMREIKDIISTTKHSRLCVTHFASRTMVIMMPTADSKETMQPQDVRGAQHIFIINPNTIRETTDAMRSQMMSKRFIKLMYSWQSRSMTGPRL
jgi:hypothetical protein